MKLIWECGISFIKASFPYVISRQTNVEFSTQHLLNTQTKTTAIASRPVEYQLQCNLEGTQAGPRNKQWSPIWRIAYIDDKRAWNSIRWFANYKTRNCHYICQPHVHHVPAEAEIRCRWSGRHVPPRHGVWSGRRGTTRMICLDTELKLSKALQKYIPVLSHEPP